MDLDKLRLDALELVDRHNANTENRQVYAANDFGVSAMGMACFYVAYDRGTGSTNQVGFDSFPDEPLTGIDGTILDSPQDALDYLALQLTEVPIK